MNRDTGIPGLIFVMSIVGAAFFVLAAAVFAACAFLALVLTVCCLFAWDQRLTLFGATLEPDDAQAFVKRGLVGAGLMCAFALFCGLLYGIQVRGDAWLYVVIAGYTAGSVGVAYLKWQSERADAGDVPPLFRPHVIDQEPKPAQPTPQAREKPFRFASWDDESERGDGPRNEKRCGSCAFNGEEERPMPGVSLR